MSPDLTTINVLLGIMAAVSVMQALAIVGTCVAGSMVYRRVLRGGRPRIATDRSGGHPR